MPKMKTHKSTAKRIKVTGTGKIMIGHGFQNKKRSAKSKRTLRTLHDMFPVSPGVERRVRARVPGLRARKKK
ncbi:MAG TPA: bL35 family ribosomal protein [Chloroflexota bacterium]|nr:bL35 family ribosomal protein [Chloroflexota bacterium]